LRFTRDALAGHPERIALERRVRMAPDASQVPRFELQSVSYREASAELTDRMTYGYRTAWESLRGYMLNTFWVVGVSLTGIIFLSTLSAYVFSRHRFPGSRLLFYGIISMMMIPGVLTLVPSFMIVKKLGLLNSYGCLILPYIAGGQIMAIFLFKGFFDALPEDLFESARIDGAGYLSIYRNIVLPLSKPIIAVVAIINTISIWNNFLWPFITNTDARYHVVASGLYLLTSVEAGSNQSVIYAAYVLSSLPLLVLFVYATKPFLKGITAGAFKA
jgi:ABC-type glycerol-3-phosphate transport system permease component